MTKNKLLDLPSQILSRIPDFITLVENILTKYNNHPTMTMDEVCDVACREIREKLHTAMEPYGPAYRIDFSLQAGGRAYAFEPKYLTDGSMCIYKKGTKFSGIEIPIYWAMTNQTTYSKEKRG